MSTPTYKRIFDHAEYHAQLALSLKELEGAPNDLARQNKYLEELLKQLKTTRDNVEKLTSVTRKETEDEKKSISRTKRFLSRRNLKEKARAQQEQEERELLEALETEIRERDNMNALQVAVEEAIRVKDSLTAKCTALNEVMEQLRVLYDEIFGGATPEFPRNNELQNNVKLAQEACDNIQALIFSHSQAENCLVQAERKLDECLAKLQTALSAAPSTNGVPSRVFNEEGREALEASSVAASEANKFLEEARLTCPQVATFEPIRIKDHPSLLENYFFTRISAHETIRNIKTGLTVMKKDIRREYVVAAQRYNITASHDLSESAEVLNQCREELFKHRREIMEQVLNSPPTYRHRSSSSISHPLPPLPGPPGPAIVVLAPPSLPTLHSSVPPPPQLSTSTSSSSSSLSLSARIPQNLDATPPLPYPSSSPSLSARISQTLDTTPPLPYPSSPPSFSAHTPQKFDTTPPLPYPSSSPSLLARTSQNLDTNPPLPYPSPPLPSAGALHDPHDVLPPSYASTWDH
ncbi:hypothetical protein Moror_14527 [Moniliophthora roreri MCA 2997]|uniref:Uncharacterized protein n=1 Tax=Moniliophthora roreri (strain MCA 2997) TaxID=1381753 RepID=V2XKE7_MONRO|nr:hypothetical protein Moror_14527 [Moniliophthora roreri MCA 2997]